MTMYRSIARYPINTLYAKKLLFNKPNSYITKWPIHVTKKNYAGHYALQ